MFAVTSSDSDDERRALLKVLVSGGGEGEDELSNMDAILCLTQQRPEIRQASQNRDTPVHALQLLHGHATVWQSQSGVGGDNGNHSRRAERGGRDYMYSVGSCISSVGSSK